MNTATFFKNSSLVPPFTNNLEMKVNFLASSTSFFIWFCFYTKDS